MKNFNRCISTVPSLVSMTDHINWYYWCRSIDLSLIIYSISIYTQICVGTSIGIGRHRHTYI
jgi:hypothetical protein